MALETEKDELLQLAADNDGLLTVESVLEAAQDEDSPLHRHFTWDDTEAAIQYRKWQARVLIAKCRITIDARDDQAIRAFVSLPSDRREDGGGYRLTVDVRDNEDQRSELMREIRNRVTYWQRQSSLLDAPTRRALDSFARTVTQTTEQPELSPA